MPDLGPGQNKRGKGSDVPLLGEEDIDLEVVMASVKRGLDLPEVLELILDFAVHDEDKVKQIQTLGSVRLVNKTWLTAVTNLMRRNKEPLFKLTLTDDNSLSGTPFVITEGKMLDQFVTAVGNRIQEPLPTFGLSIYAGYFRLENYDSLRNCLVQCGEGLVRLELGISINEGSLPGVLPRIELPNLRTLMVAFRKTQVLDAGAFGNSANVICFIQAILSGAESLRYFCVPSSSTTSSRGQVPDGIQYISLPESITKLQLGCTMRSSDLELMVRNQFPNLKTFTMTMFNEPLANGIVARILKNLCKTLQSLIIYANTEGYQGPPRHGNLVQFPVMQNLKQLTIYSSSFELEDNHPSLSEYFPKLEELALYNQTPDMMRKWTRHTTLDLVTDLECSLADESKPQSDPNYLLPLELENIQNIQATFPNLSLLSIEIPVSGASGLKHVFTTLRQLTYLQIKVVASEVSPNSDCWDAAFIGAPVLVIQGLRENPDFANSNQLKDDLISIRMLTVLETLSLKAEVKNTNGVAHESLISDLTFKFALLKMEKLEQLYFHGKFRASEAMTQEWEDQERDICYEA